MERKIYIINFGHKLNQGVLKQIKETYQVDVEEIIIPVSINFKKNNHTTYIQCVDIIDRIPKDLLDGNKKIAFNPAGLPVATVCLLTELHARIGYFPLLIELYRDKTEDPIFNEYRLRRIIDLERERQVSRSKLFSNFD